MGRRKAEGTTEKVIKKPKYVKKEKPIKPPVIIGGKEKFECGFCHKVFSSEKTQVIHICEQRRRFQQKDTIFSRYGFQVFLEIQKFSCNNNVTEDQYRHSNFYLICQKIGRFVVDVNCPNVQEYYKWLQKNNIPIDKWNNDIAYSSWLSERLFKENFWIAFERSMNTMMDWAEENNTEYSKYFLDAGGARILFDVQRGKVSGLIVYACNSGKEWLKNLFPSDLELVWPMVNSNNLASKIQKDKITFDEICNVCNEAGL